jgi:predicted transposase/invertase (TIGR01784 family)
VASDGELKSLTEEVGNPHDAFFKSLLGRRALIIEFLRHYLPKDVTADFNLRTLEVVKDSFISEELSRYFSDLIFRVKLRSGEDAYVYVLLEHKSAPEKWAPLQLLGYKVKLWERAKDAGARMLPLVIPVVLLSCKPA